MKIEIEILRTRTVRIEENVTTEVDIPARVPKRDRERWAMQQLADKKLVIPDDSYEVADETEDVEYNEVNEVS